MSAYVHDNEHIIAIVSGARHHKLEAVLIGEVYCNVSVTEHAQLVCNILLGENIRSVNYRYEKDESLNPGIVFKQDSRALSPIGLYKAINSLDYQSCESPDWRQTFACKLLENWNKQLLKITGLNEDSIYKHPKYDYENTWSIHSR